MRGSCSTRAPIAPTASSFQLARSQRSIAPAATVVSTTASPAERRRRQRLRGPEPVRAGRLCPPPTAPCPTAPPHPTSSRPRSSPYSRPAVSARAVAVDRGDRRHHRAHAHAAHVEACHLAPRGRRTVAPGDACVVLEPPRGRRAAHSCGMRVRATTCRRRRRRSPSPTTCRCRSRPSPRSYVATCSPPLASAASTSACSRPFVDTTSPPSARASPRRSVNVPPASCTITMGAARSHTSSPPTSTAMSIEPSATSTCDQKSPNPRLRQQRRASARNSSALPSRLERRAPSRRRGARPRCARRPTRGSVSPSRNAPWPRAAHQRAPSAGADTTPTTGCPSCSSATSVAHTGMPRA